jgi:fatty acid desaturase
MSAAELRRKYMKPLAGMDKHSRLGAWAIFSTYVLLILASVLLGAVLLTLPVSAWTVAAMAFLALFIGTRLRGLNNIVHECSHSTFSAHKSDNVIIGSLCASLTLGCFKDYRDEHLTHHLHTGDYERDHDLMAIQALRLEEPLTPRVVLRHFVTPLIGRHLPYYLRVSLSGRDGIEYQMLKLLILVTAAAFTYVQPMAGLLFVVAPFVLVYSTINYWTDCLDHAGLVGSSDDLESARNVLAPGLVRFLFFPRNDCYHLVHHLFPHVPARHLAESHVKLLSDEDYRTRPNAARPDTRPPQKAPALRPSRAT